MDVAGSSTASTTKRIEEFTPAEGVAMYEALTRVSARDLNIGRINSREDVDRIFYVSDPLVFEVLLEGARKVYRRNGGSKVSDVVLAIRRSIPLTLWARWSGAVPVKKGS